MEEEKIRYMQASIKGRIQITRRFSKFYLNSYRPMTKLEQSDLDKSRNMYRAYTLAGALIFGFVSFRYRRAKIGAADTAGATKENHLPMYILNDMCMGFLGFCCGQFFS